MQSIGPIPTYYLTAEADMERAWDAREATARARRAGKFSFNDLVIRSAAAALRQHPWVNAWWLDDRIRQWHDIHIGVAVAIDDGLITPVIRHADRKSLREIAGEVRNWRLAPGNEAQAGGIHRLDLLGFEPRHVRHRRIHRHHQPTGSRHPGHRSAGAEAVVYQGALAARHRMRMTMSCDHRVIDGATGAAFLKTLVAMLENPLALVW